MKVECCANCLEPLSNYGLKIEVIQENIEEDPITTTIRDDKVVSHSTSMTNIISNINSTFHNDLNRIQQIDDDDGPSHSAQEEEEKKIDVNDVISKIYRLNYLNEIKSQDDHHGNDEDDEDMKICSKCCRTLSTLYKFYDDFNQLRKLGSVLDKRIKKLDHMIQKFQISQFTKTSAAAVTVRTIADEESVPAENYYDEYNDDFGASDVDSSFEEEEDDESSNLISCKNVKESVAFMNEGKQQMKRKLQDVDNSHISGPPWVKIQKLTDHEIATATSSTVSFHSRLVKAKVTKKSYKEDSDDDNDVDTEFHDDIEESRHGRVRIRKSYKKFVDRDDAEDDMDFNVDAELDDDYEPSETEASPKKFKERSKPGKLKPGRKRGRKPKSEGAPLDRLHELDLDSTENSKNISKKPFKSTNHKKRISPPWKQLVTTLGPDGTPVTTKKVKEAFRRYSCTLCGNVYESLTGIKAHVHVHMGGKPHKCTHGNCSMSFMSQSELMKHTNIHTGEKFQCHLCQKLLSSPTTLAEHIKVIHQGVKPFLCSECGMTFPQASAMRKHLPVHSDERNFKCAFCDSTFKQKHSLSKHHGRFHSEKRHLCPSCGLTFNCAEKLKRHGKRYHSDEQPS